MPATHPTPADAVLAGWAGLRSWQEELYRDLHAHPELGFAERRTAGIVAARLGAAGFTVHEDIGGTGVVGILHNGEGPVVLCRADMDALPVTERTGLPYASTATVTDDSGQSVGVMHACGHDVHVSTLLGAAQLLADSASSWSGTLVTVFQPAEEIATGAQKMLDDGLAALVPRPDVALGQHVMPLPAGTVGVRSGPILSAGDSIKVTVHGKGSHGSMPQSSVDPVVLAAMIVIRLHTVVSREIKPGEFAVLTIGSVQAGTKSNVISDHAVLRLNLRSYDTAVRDRLIAAVERIVRAECAASGSPAPPEFEYYDHFPLTSNDPVSTERLAEAFRNHFPAGTVVDADRVTASEDFSHIPDALGSPYVYWVLGGTDPDAYAAAAAAGTVDTDIPVNHSAFFAPVPQPTLRAGTEAMVVAALSYLAD